MLNIQQNLPLLVYSGSNSKLVINSTLMLMPKMKTSPKANNINRTLLLPVEIKLRSSDKPWIIWNAQPFTLGGALVARACLWSLCSVNSGVTLRQVPNCVTALIFTHQSWALNWYSPSLINALHCKSFTALCSLFIFFCCSGHQKRRSDMSVMVHLNGRTWMTACVAFPLWNPRRERQRGRTLLAQLCTIKVESILPVLAYNHNDVCEMRMAARWHCLKSSLQHKHQLLWSVVK